MNENKSKVPTPSVTAQITWINTDPDAKRVAAADITIAGSFAVHGLSIMKTGENKHYVTMPARPNEKHGEKKYYDVAHPITAEMREAVNKAVMGAFSQHMTMALQYRDVPPYAENAPNLYHVTPEEASNLPFDMGDELSGGPSEQTMGMAM